MLATLHHNAGESVRLPALRLLREGVSACETIDAVLRTIIFRCIQHETDIDDVLTADGFAVLCFPRVEVSWRRFVCCTASRCFGESPISLPWTLRPTFSTPMFPLLMSMVIHLSITSIIPSIILTLIIFPSSERLPSPLQPMYYRAMLEADKVRFVLGQPPSTELAD